MRGGTSFGCLKERWMTVCVATLGYRKPESWSSPREYPGRAPVRRYRCRRPLPRIMTKHSKNNTASSIFSYAERKKLDYGTKGDRMFAVLFTLPQWSSVRQQRLENESMRRFDACALCLQRARDPVACQGGHLFCKECAYTDLCEFVMVITRFRDVKLVQWRRRRI